MSHPLEQQIATLRARVRRLVAVHGVSWVVAAVLGTVIVLGTADYVIRFQDPGLRVICSLLVFAALGWTCYRYLYLPLLVRLRDVDLALRLERRFPALEDRLVSSVEFLGQSEDDPTAGSAALRRAVIAQATAETERLDFSDVLDRRGPLRAAIVSTGICLVAAILVVLDPLCSRIALARLVNPFGSVAWPQENHLKLRRQVSRVARGQSFEVEVVDARGVKLPPEVRIHYRFEDPDGTVAEQSELLRPVGDAAVARRDNVIRPFSYRAEGGDDDSMPWISVEVVEPPEIRSLSTKLIPPAYTGWPPEKAGQQIRALVGTRMQIAAKTTKPLQSAVLCFEDGREISGRVSDDAYRFTLPPPDAPELLVKKSGTYWFELTDRQGLSGGDEDRREIRAVPDTAPTISIEHPTADVFVTSRAEVQLRVAAKDDLAIREVALVFSMMDQPEQDGAEQKATLVPLYAGPEHVAPQPAGGLLSGADLGDRQVIEHRWNLAELELPPGAQLTFHATATDYRPQTGRSRPRRLTVITPEALQQRIANRSDLILAELARVLKMQRGSRSQVRSLGIRLGEIGRLEQPDVDHLQAAELSQRQINRNLTSRSQGVPGHILALLADLENNKVDSPDLRRRMQGLLGEIGRLKREHLPLIGGELSTAIKAAQVALEEKSRPPPEKAIAASLTGAGEHQDQVIASLQRMLDQLAQWDDYRRFHRELSQLRRDQQQLAGRTAEVGRDTLTKELNDLRPQQRADLKVLARRQLELARQLDRIQQEMQQAAGTLQQNDPPAAETVADALAEARRLIITAQMRASGDHVGSNQIGQALRRQKQIVRDLQAVLDILANRRRQELGRWQDVVEHLRRRQENVIRETERFDALRQSEGRLSRAQTAELRGLAGTQQGLQTETVRLADRLLDTPVFHLALSGAAHEMGQAAALLARGQTDSPTLQAEKNALGRLELVLEALKAEKPGVGPRGGGAGGGPAAGGDAGGAEAALRDAVQTLAELKLLKLLQQELNLRTMRLQQSGDAADTLTDQQRHELGLLSRQQGQLADLALQLMQAESERPEDDPAGRPDMRLDEEQQSRPVPQEGLP